MKSFDFCFDGSEKLFCCLLFFICFLLLLSFTAFFVTMFVLLYRFFAFIVLFEERCFVVDEGIEQGGVPEADKCLGEVVDGYSLQI